jgi:hypothetical protein
MSMVKIVILVAQLVRGFISGTVTDASDSAVAGVQITITNKATNISRETFTSESGFYRFVALEPGEYSVAFGLAGFETRKVENVEVRTAQETVINQTLRPGGVSTEVTVLETPGAELQKTTATIERTFSGRVIQELPLPVYDGARDITRLALLAPTVNRAPGSNEFAANGQRARSNNFTVDGVDNNDLSVATSSAGIIPEAVDEVQVQTTSYSAEFGRTVGAQFSAITKSGGNALHGQGWDYYSGNWLEPLSLTNKRAGLQETPRFVANDFGGSLGGPIVKNRTFFFGLFSGNLRREAASAGNATSVNVPTAAGYGALSTVPLGPGEQQGSRQAALSALSFLPDIYSHVTSYDNLHNVVINGAPLQIGTVVIPLPAPFTHWYSAGRIDHRLTSRDNLTYRYHLDKRDEPNTTSNLGFGTRFTAAAKILRQNHAVSYTRSFTPRFLNEARAAYVRSFLNFQENDPKSSTVTISGFFTIGGTSGFPQGRVEQLYEWQDVASYLAGRNSFRFGIDIRRNKLFGRFGTNSKEKWAFGGVAEFLNSTPSSLSQAINEATFNVNQWHQSYFFQDDLKASKALTINLGLRYEYATIPAGFFGAVDPAVKVVGVPGPAQPDKNNFAPRFGFAYSPSATKGGIAGLLGDGKTSIRGGFGMSYDVLFYNIIANAASNYPRVVTQILTGAAIANTYPTLAPKVATVPPLNPLGTFTNTPEHVQDPTVNFWSLSIQRELGTNYVLELGYTGNRSYHELRQSQANPGVLTTAQAATVIASGLPNSVTVQRRNPAWGARNLLETSAKSAYHAGYMKFDRRFSKGLIAGLNYTWSANFSDNDEAFTVADIAPWSSQIPQDFSNLRNEWSRSVFDRPQRFVVHYLYEVPWFSSGSRTLREMFGGWQVAGFTEYQSGQVFTITTGLDSVGTLVTGSFPGRPNYNPSGLFAKDPVTRDLRTFATPINGTGIVVAPLGPNGLLANSMPGGGNLGRNTFRGPSFQNWNFSLAKRVRIKEDVDLQLRGDFVNAWNHNNFRPPESRMTSPAFGSNNATLVTDSRDILLSVKLRF